MCYAVAEPTYGPETLVGLNYTRTDDIAGLGPFEFQGGINPTNQSYGGYDFGIALANITAAVPVIKGGVAGVDVMYDSLFGVRQISLKYSVPSESVSQSQSLAVMCSNV